MQARELEDEPIAHRVDLVDGKMIQHREMFEDIERVGRVFYEQR